MLKAVMCSSLPNSTVGPACFLGPYYIFSSRSSPSSCLLLPCVFSSQTVIKIVFKLAFFFFFLCIWVYLPLFMSHAWCSPRPEGIRSLGNGYGHIYVWIYVWIWTYICMCMCICICVYMHVYIYVYVYMYMFMYMYTYIFIYIILKYINNILFSLYNATCMCVFMAVTWGMTLALNTP